VFLHTGAGDDSEIAGRYQAHEALRAFCQSVFDRSKGQLRHWNNGVQLLEGDG
jgi:hypothetical protein